MKYALISDVHGNMPALQAVIDDAKKNDVQHYVFLGDYCIGLAYPNDVLDCIRALDSSYVVSGNEDESVSHHKNILPTEWPDGQYQAHSWCYQNLTGVNRDFISSLPQELVIRTDGKPPLHIFHKPERYFPESSASKINPQFYARNIDGNTFTIESFRAYCDNLLEEDSLLSEQLTNLEDGVYIFGHKHIQWFKELDGKLLINPGSCGVALDFQTSAAYAILHSTEHSDRFTESYWKCELRRVDYDISGSIKEMDKSQCAKELPVWYGVISKEMETAREQAIPFLHFTEKYANNIGDTIRPFTRKTWHDAYREWLNLMES